MLVDDHEGTRNNIKGVLQYETDIEIVGEAATGYEGIAVYDKVLPDVVCTNVCMPDMDGITMTRHICNKHKDARIFILSVQNEPNYMRMAMEAGALDYLTKPPSSEELIHVTRMFGRRGSGSTDEEK